MLKLEMHANLVLAFFTIFLGSVFGQKIVDEGNLDFMNGHQKVRYNGDQVFRLNPSSVDKIQFLDQLVRQHPHRLRFWKQTGRVGGDVDLHVKKEALSWARGVFHLSELPFSIRVSDVQELIDRTDEVNARLRWEARDNQSVVGHFVEHKAINDWLDSVCKTYPKLASCGLGGTTFKNRQIRFIRLGTAASKEGTKPIILIVGGIHAREWLAPATLVHIINHFVTTYSSDDTSKQMLDQFDWYILPVVNPDGYEYTRTDDRLWRKTRSAIANSTCIGVDGNRNFNFHWGSDDTPCSDTYPGPQALSEVEAMSIADFTKSQHIPQLLAFFSIHTYSKLWMLPYGYQAGARPADYKELLRVGTIGVNALMAVNEQDWSVGNIVDELYVAAGNSVDWFKHAGAKYTFVLELRGDDFIVPETEIDPSGHEVLAGFVAAVKAMKTTTD